MYDHNKNLSFMNDPGILIPILVPLGLFCYDLWYCLHEQRENLAMIDKGMNLLKGLCHAGLSL